MEHIVRKLRLKRIQCPVVYQCALLSSYLKTQGVSSELKKGFISFGGFHCPHVWVETEKGEQLDIGTYSGLRISPELSKFGIKLNEVEPENSKRMDTEEEYKKIITEMEAHYEVYTKDQKLFWKERPLQLRGFKF